MTINKSQSSTLRIVEEDLREDCFSHGQLYVACSRVNAAQSKKQKIQLEGRAKNTRYKKMSQYDFQE